MSDENKEDAEVETAAAVINDLLYLIPRDKRAAALARAIEVEAAHRKLWASVGPPICRILDTGTTK
jgi:hypothetical protein